jgi:Ran GTPase-activating protein (RanGAP) involved in mRNA processing and transport
LLELNLSSNKIGDQGVEDLTKVFHQNVSCLMKLDLSNCGITCSSIGKLFYSLKSNNFLKYLNLESNDFNGPSFNQISIFLLSNRRLESLNLGSCNINSDGAHAIGEGLCKNTALKYLDLSQNKIEGHSLKRWADCLGKTSLTHLDLSNNDLEDKGVLHLVKGL